MYEIVTCPQCRRKLQLPVEFMGRDVQCPRCETCFVAREDQPLPPPPTSPEAITPTPLPPVGTADTDADLDPVPVRRRRPRTVESARTPHFPAKSRIKPILFLLAVAGGTLLVCGLIIFPTEPEAIREPDPPPPNFVAPLLNPPAFVVGNPPPPIEVPDRILTAAEQEEHAKAFFQYFSQVMRRQNNADEMACIDADNLLDRLFEHELLPDAWQRDRVQLLRRVRQEVLHTSLYRGEHWAPYEIKTVKQPRERELIVVTRHPHPATAGVIRLRWWLKHRDGSWRIEEMEDLDYGIPLSQLVASRLRPIDGKFAHREMLALRDAADAVIVKSDFQDAERILDGIAKDKLPMACAGTHHMLMALIRLRQLRREEALALYDDAERCRGDIPGADWSRCIALNGLQRWDLALKHARIARDWLGDDPSVCYELGLALHGLLRFSEAAAQYRIVLDREPNHANALLSLLRCLGPDVTNDDIQVRFGKLQRPQDQFEPFAQDRWKSRDAATLQILAETMRKLEPRRPDVSYYLALAHAEQQRLRPALVSLKRALDLQNLEALRDVYYDEFARTNAAREHAQEVYADLPDRARSFRALGESLRNAGRMEDLEDLVDLRAKDDPKDIHVQLYQAEKHLRDEEYTRADRAFTQAFAATRDEARLEVFRFGRIRARYMTGDVLGAYRDIRPQRVTFQQLANSCWVDKKTDDLAKLLAEHAKKDPDDPQLARMSWRANILARRYAEAGKELKARLQRNPGAEESRFLVEDFLLDMIDVGQALEGYRSAPNPEAALDIIMGDLFENYRAKQRKDVLEEHRQRFPKDPVLLLYAGQEAAAREDWAKAVQAYRDGWKLLPEAKQPRWAHAYLFACCKLGQAVEAYRDTGKRIDYFRQLAGILLADKQTDRFVALLDAHQPQSAKDPEFAAYEARRKILRGQPVEAAEILTELLKKLPVADQRRIGDSFQRDLAGYHVAVETYLCIPDKRDTFANIVWRYRVPEKLKEFDRLIAEHTKHHPDDPRLLIERAELHMLRKEFAQAEQQFLAVQNKNLQDVGLARSGLLRARIKLGKTVETYRERGPSAQTFQEIANQCVLLKDAVQLERLITAHRQEFPAAKNLSLWEIEAHWLKKDYEATAKAIRSDRAKLLKNANSRWKCESYLVRSLVRSKKSAEAVMEAEAITQRKDSLPVLLALALASTSEVPRVLSFLEAKKDQPYFIDDCYHDEDLGPILRGDAFRTIRDAFPPPTRTLPNARAHDLN